MVLGELYVFPTHFGATVTSNGSPCATGPLIVLSLYLSVWWDMRPADALVLLLYFGSFYVVKVYRFLLTRRVYATDRRTDRQWLNVCQLAQQTK